MKDKNGNKINFIVDGEEITAYYKGPTDSAQKVKLRVGDKIQYPVKDPTKVFPDSIKGIVILSCVEAVIVAVLIGTTVYEIKKGM